MKNKALYSGERQVHASLEGIEYWHKWRYTWAQGIILPEHTVLDLGCGCGYGSFILSQKAKEVVGVDDSFEAITFAKTHYHNHNITFCCCDFLGIGGYYDVVIAFEFIEHIEYTIKAFEKLNELAKKYIILSVPDIKTPLLSPFHYRHFSQAQIEHYLASIQFEIISMEERIFSGGPAIVCYAERKNP